MAPAAASSSKSDNRSSKKRKVAPAQAADTRFSFAAQDLDDAPPPPQLSDNEQEGDEDDEELGDILAGPSTTPSTLPLHLLPSNGKAQGTPGLIYLSRIPPGMGPSKVKHLLSAYGETGRVFLARSGELSPPPLSFARRTDVGVDPTPPQDLKSRKRQKDKHREHRFAEGWVEFMDKKVARKVAELMNANTIGSYSSLYMTYAGTDVGD
jgi:ESF2/ABP1 family protein